jgi:hypothetical protein
MYLQGIRDQFWLLLARKLFATRICPESFSLGSYLKLTKKIGRYHLILYGSRSQAINKNKLLDKTHKILYTWTAAGDGG